MFQEHQLNSRFLTFLRAVETPQTDNYGKPHHSLLRGQMLFLMPNQRHQSTEGSNKQVCWISLQSDQNLSSPHITCSQWCTSPAAARLCCWPTCCCCCACCPWDRHMDGQTDGHGTILICFQYMCTMIQRNANGASTTLATVVSHLWRRINSRSCCGSGSSGVMRGR